MPTTYAIPNGRTVMDATLYTGTTAYPQTVVNQTGFKPDLVWAKSRSNAQYNGLFDPLRSGYALYSNTTDAQDTTEQLTFNSNGFSTPNKSADFINTNGATYVAWQWQAGAGTSSTNTNGSVNSTVSVNQTAGFSIATFTTAPSGTSFTYGHGLGVAPSFCILKITNSSTNWSCYHTSIGNTANIFLNATNAINTTSGAWNNTSPSNSVVTVGSAFVGSVPMVAYNWAAVPGFSAFGSYTGNGSTDGPFVYTGFKPKFLMYKRTDSAGGWFMVDSTRNPYNTANYWLNAAASDVEQTDDAIDLNSNGFKIRTTGTGTNANGGTYVYMVWAENPFKYATAR